MFVNLGCSGCTAAQRDNATEPYSLPPERQLRDVAMAAATSAR
jgi:hypothetical protein